MIKEIFICPAELDANAMRHLKLDFEGLISKETDITLDFKQVEFVDSSGIGGIVFLYKRLIAAKLKLQIINAQGQPLNLLTHLRLFDILVKS